MRRQLFMKLWGITGSSVFLKLPYDVRFQCDVMHCIDLGITPWCTALILQRAIDEKYISLEYLNSRLGGFQYSYLDRKEVPECITRKQIYEDAQIKQTAATRHMTYILPFILHDKFPEGDEHYKNYMRLIAISTLCGASVVDKDSSGQWQILVEMFLREFKRLYPRVMLRPKLHWLLHMPQLLLDFGPLRCNWLYRFEAKNNFLKQMRPRNFFNVSYSLMRRSQIHTCYKYNSAGADGNFLLKGDQIASGLRIHFGEKYPELLGEYTTRIDHADLYVNYSKVVQLDGLEYRDGAVLLHNWLDNWPGFVLIEDIFSHEDVAFAVCTVMETEIFEWTLNAYRVTKTEQKTIIVMRDLDNPWPLAPYDIGGETFVANRYCHFTQYF